MNLKPFGGATLGFNGPITIVKAFKAAPISQQKTSLVKPGSQFRDAQDRQSARTMFGPSSG
jgi:hypothetical protein